MVLWRVGWEGGWMSGEWPNRVIDELGTEGLRKDYGPSFRIALRN